MLHRRNPAWSISAGHTALFGLNSRSRRHLGPLRGFSSNERRDLPSVIVTAADAVEAVITDGIAAAQNKYHSE